MTAIITADGDAQPDLPRRIRRGAGHEGAKVESAGQVAEPRRPVESAAGLPHDITDRSYQAHSQREDLRAQQRFPDAFDGRVAAAQLSAPPDHARRLKPRFAGRLYPFAAERLLYHHQFPARRAAARGHSSSLQAWGHWPRSSSRSPSSGSRGQAPNLIAPSRYSAAAQSCGGPGKGAGGCWPTPGR